MNTKKISKRNDYLTWDEYFMGIALMSAQRSKDPGTQVGACIVNEKKRIVGVGYNGFPTGCSDDDLPWDREGDFLDTKYPYVCHAELNAVLNRIDLNLDKCTIYAALFPCNECAKVIIQSGIKEVVFLNDKYAHTDPVKASKKMFEQSGVTCRKLVIERAPLVITWGKM
jgi:dCMP deaminase